MRNQTTPSIAIALKPSYLILGWYAMVSIVSVLSLVWLPIVMPVKLVLIACVIIAGLYVIIRDAFLMLPWSWQHVAVDGKGNITLSTREKRKLDVILTSSTLNHAHLVVLNFKRAGRRFGYQRAVYLTPIRVENPDQLRLLRVWLRWHKHKPHGVTS